MPLVLRVIRKSRWYKPEAADWLSTGDIHADPLADLQTKDNALSVWKIEEGYSNWDILLTAVAANRSYISNIDYAVFGEDLILEHQIGIKASRGATPLKEANDFHLDLLELSGYKLVELAKSIMETAKIGRVPEKEIEALLKNALAQQKISIEQLKLGEEEIKRLSA